MRTTGRNQARENGASIVEFSFVLLPLLTLILGAVSFGVLLAHKQVMHQAAGEAARTAMLVKSADATDQDAANAATERIRSMLKGDACNPTEGFRCDITFDTACGPTTCVRVEIERDLETNPVIAPLPFLQRVLPSSLRADASVRLP